MSRINIHRLSYFECASISSLDYKDLRPQLSGDDDQERHNMLGARGWAVLGEVNDESSEYPGMALAHQDRRHVVAHQGNMSSAQVIHCIDHT